MPSRALQRHPRRCGSTGRQDAATPVAVCLMASRQLHPRVSVRTMTKREIPTPPPSKLLLGRYRAYHDAPPEARFVRTAVYSTTLCAIPLHAIRIVWHACKLPPLAYKRRGQSPCRKGDDGSEHTYTLTAFTTILALASIQPQEPGGSASSPASLVAPLCKHHGATQYSASSTPLLDVRPRPEPG
jgi:hypothetical protein